MGFHRAGTVGRLPCCLVRIGGYSSWSGRRRCSGTAPAPAPVASAAFLGACVAFHASSIRQDHMAYVSVPHDIGSTAAVHLEWSLIPLTTCRILPILANRGGNRALNVSDIASELTDSNVIVGRTSALKPRSSPPRLSMVAWWRQLMKG